MALWSEIFLFYISIGVQDLWFLQHWHQQSGGHPGDQIQEVRVWSDLHREVEYWQHPGHRDHHWRPGLNASSITEWCLIKVQMRNNAVYHFFRLQRDWSWPLTQPSRQTQGKLFVFLQKSFRFGLKPRFVSVHVSVVGSGEIRDVMLCHDWL